MQGPLRCIPAFLLLLGLGFAPQPIAADDPAGVRLAPPGPCAEPRTTAAELAASDFSIVGPVSALFSPVDVAAGPLTRPGLAPPTPSGLVRPGACDQPGSGCGLGTSRRTTRLSPIEPGGRR